MPLSNVLDYDHPDLQTRMIAEGEAPWRASQVLRWIFKHGVTDFAGMSNLSKSLRARMQQIFCTKLPEIIKVQQSGDGTRKWLLRMDAQNAIEMVFIPEDDRGTLCISSQVGCPLDCQFCATAKQGFNRNLSTAEIIGQVWLANRELGHFQHGRRVITNIVFMGMGEPLLNYDNVLRAIHLLTDDHGFGLARRKVTVSTAGVAPGIERLATDSNVSLALSLHAPTDPVRSQLVPLNRKYNIATLLAACRHYIECHRDATITIEYVMLKELNDRPQDARELVALLRGLPVKINLIPFNRFPECAYQCSAPDTIQHFRQTLMDAGLVTIVRRTRGDDIAAACGQLAGSVLARGRYRVPAASGDRA